MEKIILGLLMIKAMSGYEMRSFIKNHLALMCSDSAGSFQTALQKLLAKNMISSAEHVEKGKNKKTYTITDEGRDAFFQWEEQPMNHKRAKNIELVKLFFLGTLSAEKRGPLLQAYLSQLVAEQKELITLREEIWESKAAYLKSIADNKESMDRFRYQMATLDYGIASFTFEIEWFGQFLQKMEENTTL